MPALLHPSWFARGLIFENSILTCQGAIDGLGVAIAQLTLVADDLATGRLVVPFDVNTPYPTEIAGTAMPTYIDWMRSCWYITMMSNPAISVPGGFSTSGLPIGLQIVGRHRDDWGVLQLAHAFEQATLHVRRQPSLG